MATTESMREAVLEEFADGLHFPTSLAFDAAGVLHVAESGLPFAGAPAGGRILRQEPGGAWTCLADGLRQPLNGLVRDARDARESFLVAEGGSPGRISRLAPDGTLTTLVDGLPGAGNYHTNMAVPGPDGWLYWSVGAMTNLGVVGLDGSELAWLRRVDHTWDVPGWDVVLTGKNFTTPRAPGASETATTGAFSPFGTATGAGDRVAAGFPPTASVLRCRPDGSKLELFAWGLRNAYGLGFTPGGRLLATDQGADDRGSRPIGQAPELLFEVRRGAWYGWPDFVGGVPVTDTRFRPTRGGELEFLLANHDDLPPPEGPLARLPVNAAATKFVVAPASSPHPGQLYLALFGDEKPMTAPPGPRVGRSVVRVDLADGSYHPLASGEGLERPIDVAVDPAEDMLYILDFGDFEMEEGGRIRARAGSGKIWRTPLAALDR